MFHHCMTVKSYYTLYDYIIKSQNPTTCLLDIIVGMWADVIIPSFKYVTQYYKRDILSARFILR